ncbi:hypothetical protein [Candidatus Contendibacter odensensis]|uniref:Uncharacterized protein n=1 Tax=Candidatus Contendobacter odensis Run_B_J11 TaxID=1400861 RepID=A0A7U7GG55_9GAMM|nr:hypothetical protein [Candidatus Contendobacter odensis]CDH47675.1 hypothetical protein BN874_890005 [Candidatus Contendobacter odensis Run_B_J11]
MKTIPRSPQPTPKPATVQQEQRAEKFINKANKESPPPTPPYSTTLRIPPDLLRRVDVAAGKKHITRSAWIKATLSEVLDQDGIE